LHDADISPSVRRVFPSADECREQAKAVEVLGRRR
jgi:hypothetical protein